MSALGWLALSALAVVCAIVIVQLRDERRLTTSLSTDLSRSRGAALEANIRLGDLEQTLAALSAASGDALLMVDRQRTILFANEAARQLSERAVAGTSLIQALRLYELEGMVDDTFAQQPVGAREVHFNGRLYRATAHATGKNVALGLRDVSELQRLGRARRDFVANLSHELRTPLTTIKLLAEGLRSEPPNEERKQAVLTQIDNQTDVLAQITQEMYDLSQIESGRLPMRLIETALAPVANDVIAKLTPLAERAGLELRNDLPLGAEALIDGEQMARVLTNLINNAIKFTTRGSVEVLMQAVDPNADFITVGVRDTGIGIALDMQTRIFERFYKVDRARGQRGTGLGLAIAKHIVEAHGGHIWVESVLGHGSTFWFTVPRP